MTDYISRAEAIERMSGSNIENFLDSVPTSETRRYARAAQRVIWSIPAADVAPVVRCRECMWYEIVELKKDGTEDKRYNPSVCMLYCRGQSPDYYCADGKKKEENHAGNNSDRT